MKIENQSGSERVQKKGNKRTMTMIICMILLIGVGIGGTVAWLVAGTDPVVNTFTYGDISLKLEETKLNEKGEPEDKDGDGILDKTTKGNTYDMIPEEEYLKDPIVTVNKGNEACWLFVRLEESGGASFEKIVDGEIKTITYDFDDYLIYEVNETETVETLEDGWIQLTEIITDAAGTQTTRPVEGVYYRYVGANKENLEDPNNIGSMYEIIKDNKITVKKDVTKDMLNVLDLNGADKDNATYPKLSVTAYAVQYSGFETEIGENVDLEDELEKDPDYLKKRMNAAAYKAWTVVVETQQLNKGETQETNVES